MSDKDYSLLRPFDLEAAKRGEPMFLQLNNGAFNDIPRTCLAGPDGLGKVCFQINYGLLDIAHKSDLRMAPLCWVEGKPVYKGDVLYHHVQDRAGYYTFTAEDFSDGKLGLKSNPEGYLVASPGNLTWTPPKVKREAWVNVYPGPDTGFHPGAKFDGEYPYTTKEIADKQAAKNRLACVRIEWEEPA